MDESGSLSHEATVIIRIEKAQVQVNLFRHAANGAAYAAVRLAEEEILRGRVPGGQICLLSDTEVSRGEVLAMCMSWPTPSFQRRPALRFLPMTATFPVDAPLCLHRPARGAITGESGERGATFSRPGHHRRGGRRHAEQCSGLNNVSYVSAGVEVPQWAAQGRRDESSASRIIFKRRIRCGMHSPGPTPP